VLSNDEAIAKFKEIIGSAETWQNLKDSQFVNHMAIFQTWALRDAQYRAERAIQVVFPFHSPESIQYPGTGRR